MTLTGIDIMTDTLFIPSGHFKKASGIFKTIRYITVTPTPMFK